MAELTVIYSVYNRSGLFRNGLKTLLWQTLSPEKFEVLVIDDGSTEDIPKLLREFKDSLRIRYIRYDHTKHPIYQELNPDGLTEEVWFHTQAISANIGIRKAESEYICISQPEMLHAPDNLRRGLELARTNRQVFAELWLATERFNDWLREKEVTTYPFEELLAQAMNCGTEYAFEPPGDHLYWYIQFFPKIAAIQIGGVDEEYLRGVYAEDDNFKARLRMNGLEELYAGRADRRTPFQPNIVAGIHQSHYHEKELYKKQDRDGLLWQRGSETNRSRWLQWRNNPQAMANEGKEWGNFDYITEEVVI